MENNICKNEAVIKGYFFNNIILHPWISLKVKEKIHSFGRLLFRMALGFSTQKY
uniref:Uncharacterized protein n=1 Tax=Lepeophtheirus salmonis TaxID=72036 RepID=A0A0K2TVG3_LEPSM